MRPKKRTHVRKSTRASKNTRARKSARITKSVRTVTVMRTVKAVRTKKAVPATELDLISPFANWEGTIYGANGDVPKDIRGWQKLSGSFTAKSENKIKLDTAGQPFDRYLVWITKLSGEQAGIMELSLLAQNR